ncbi:MAG: DUF4340 domain-containing protein, partial [Candidatus Rokubacteria bacterium]|nr:DUF4340 domain-containing protein [Candidatus Rokubacteria bacterium]
MRWQTTAALALVLIALGAFYYVYEIRLAPEREKTAAGKGRVFTAESADVAGVDIKRGGDHLKLKRESDGWQVLEPVPARGDRGKIEDVLTTILTAKMEREVAARPATLADFGLDKPAADVTLTLKDGKQLGLALGAKNPTGVWVYARERDKPAVFLLPESVLREAALPVADFRDKTVLAFDRGTVTGLEIVTREDTLAIEHVDQRWKLTRPRPLDADPDTIGDFLDKLTGAKVKEFVAEAPRSLQPYGLERPVRVAVHLGRDKDRATKSLLLGSVDDKKKGVYAMRPGETSVLLLPEDVWTALPKNAAAIRNKAVVEFERDKVTRLDLTSPRGQLTAVKSDGNWRITQPEALAADPVEVGAVLMKIRNLKAHAFLSEDAAGISRYLANPEVRATLTIQGAPAPVTLLLGPSPERRGGQPTAYAAVAGRGPVVLVEGSALADIGRSLTDLRDHTLIGGLEPKDVKRVQVKSG